LPLDIKRFYAWDFSIAAVYPRFTRSSDIRFNFNNQPDVIENMVARDGVEPPTPAFSGSKLTVIA
jgi:hypothetical protein